jgi:hypothetical protein
LIEHRDRRERAIAARGAEDHLLPVTRPADDFVVAGMERQPLRRAAGRRHHEDVVIAVTVRRERDPLAVGGKPRVDLARDVIGHAVRVAPVLVGGPDVAEIAERDLSGVVIRMPRQFHRRRAE